MANILVITPLATHPDISGARRRINAQLSFLQHRGHRIHLVYTCCENVDPGYRTGLMLGHWDTIDTFPTDADFDQPAGEVFGLDDWVNDDLISRIPELCQRYEITHCLVNYVFQSRYLEACGSGILKIVDTHDRLSRCELFKKNGLQPGFFYTTEEEEMRGLARADIVLAIQDNEVSYFAQSGSPVLVVGHIAEQNFVDRRYAHLQRVGYLGAPNKFNEVSIRAFLSHYEVFARRHAEPPKLTIAGRICELLADHNAVNYDHVELCGPVDSLRDFFGTIDLFVNPTTVGTGLKIKSIEAMSFGVPILSTKIGWDGLRDELRWHQAETLADLVEGVRELHEQPFPRLAELANVSRAMFAEYQRNLRDNLALLFEAPPDKAVTAARRNPRYIGARQDENPDFTTLAGTVGRSSAKKFRFEHVFNTVCLPQTSDLYVALPMAVQSMVEAKRASGRADVSLVRCYFEEDAAYLSSHFDRGFQLESSAIDLLGGTRKLPLLRDVLEREQLDPDSDYVVYTNSDIGLLPHFYDFCAEQLARGHDAIVINRRTISRNHASADRYLEATAELGTDHPGYDCFVFRRELLDRFVLGDTLVGAHLIGRVLFWNIAAYARSPVYFPVSHLTFHIGDDVPSKSRENWRYVDHNLDQGRKVAMTLKGNRPATVFGMSESERKRLYQISPGPKPEGVERSGQIMMIHALFRTGSTFLFGKFRQLADWTCYYEPFHEDVAFWSAANVERARATHSGDRFGHTANIERQWLFAEYEPLIEAYPRGIATASRDFSFPCFFGGREDDTAAYIRDLRQSASTANVLFQFNRSALRQRMLMRLFPEARHYYLRRNIDDIWGSYLSHVTNGIPGFVRNNLAPFSFAPDHPLSRRLGEFMPIMQAPNIRWFHAMFGEAFGQYSLEQHYLVHAVLWYAAEREAELGGSYVIDLEEMRRQPFARLATELDLYTNNAPLAFDDIALTRYQDSELQIDRERRGELQWLAREIVDAWEPSANATSGGGESLSSEAAPPERGRGDRNAIAEIFARHAEKNMQSYDRNALTTDFVEASPETLRKGFERLKQYAQETHQLGPLLAPSNDLPLNQLARMGFLAGGFDNVEKGHVWMNGHFGLIRFRVPKSHKARRLSIRFRHERLLAARENRAVVLVDGETVDELPTISSYAHHDINLKPTYCDDDTGEYWIGFYSSGITHIKRDLSLDFTHFAVISE